jgi:hypothetical protein
MKKNTKKGEPDKDEMKAEDIAAQNSFQKSYRDHKNFDHTHGRVNTQPFGINHEPGLL